MRNFFLYHQPHIGNTICALGEAAARPVKLMVVDYIPLGKDSEIILKRELVKKLACRLQTKSTR